MCDLLQGLLKTTIMGDTTSNASLSSGPANVYSSEQMHRYFVFALMWSVGAPLELDDRAKMEHFLRNHRYKLDLPKCQEEETIFEYMVDKVGLIPLLLPLLLLCTIWSMTIQNS